jgi:hypothetical protein
VAFIATFQMLDPGDHRGLSIDVNVHFPIINGGWFQIAG